MASSGSPQLRLERSQRPEHIPIPRLSWRIPLLQDSRAGCGLVQTELCIGRFREPRREHPSFSANYTAASGWILENHCSAGLLDDVQPTIGVICGSDNHMFGAIHSPDRMTRSATSMIVGKGAQSD
jgi:hypothetical protein